MAEPDYDYLNLATNPYILKLLRRYGSERVIWSSKEKKVNGKGKVQERVLVITDGAVYNMKVGDYGKFQRRIKLENIGAVTVSREADEFVMHIPEEYDYRYKSVKKVEVSELLKKLYNAKTGKKLKIIDASQKDLETMIISKDDVVQLPRAEIVKRKLMIAKEDHDSDKEETGKDDGDVEQLVGSPTEKLTIESFDLLRVLGRGAFGKVMQVRKKDTGKIYAMKILKKTMVFARKQVEHTLAEKKVLESFQHPYLMGLRFAFQSEAKLYLVMDYFKGGELFFHLRKVKRFSEEQARIFVAQIALALGHLHKMSFIYRDLKPENILMDELGNLCLTDFGLAKQLDAEHEEAHSFVGTPEYLAPEMVQGTGHGLAVDWWCLGILLYELTVGITPFYSGNVEEMYHKICNGRLRFPPKLSEECKNLITALLQRNPEERLGSGPDDVEEIKAHKFFEGLDWDLLLKKGVEPLYKPSVSEAEDYAGNVSDQFLKEAAVDSVVPDSHLKGLPAEGSDFTTWTFVGDTALEGSTSKSIDFEDEE